MDPVDNDVCFKQHFKTFFNRKKKKHAVVCVLKANDNKTSKNVNMTCMNICSAGISCFKKSISLLEY